MITITFNPQTYAQGSAVANAILQYLAATEVDGMREQAAPPAPAEDDKAEPKKATRAAKKEAAEQVEKPAVTPAAAETARAEAAAPTPAPESRSEGPTLVDVRAKLAALSQAGEAERVKELLKKYGAAKLTDVPAASYAQLLADAEGLA